MFIAYSDEEHEVWNALMKQQLPLANELACKEYLHGLSLLDFSIKKIPDLSDISKRLNDISGWRLLPVNSIVPKREFLAMLSNKQFPVVATIRSRDELDFYTNESPDIFHELFGHCPLLTNEIYANHLWKFGQLSLNCNNKVIHRLSEIFWATFEFGLIDGRDETKIYGAGILPSKTEIDRIISNKYVNKVKLNIFSKINVSLQGNIVQSTYYTINCLEHLYYIIDHDIQKLISLLESNPHMSDKDQHLY